MRSDIVQRFLETIKYNLNRFHLNTQLCKHQGYWPINVGLCLMQASESWNFSYNPNYHYSEKEVCLMCGCEWESVRSQITMEKHEIFISNSSHKLLSGYNRTCEIKVIPSLLHKSSGWMSGSVASYIPPPDSHCSQACFYSLSVFWGKMPSLTTS